MRSVKGLVLIYNRTYVRERVVQVDFSKATKTELLTVLYWDQEATTADQDAAARELVGRQQKKRKPHQRLNQQIKRVYPR